MMFLLIFETQVLRSGWVHEHDNLHTKRVLILKQWEILSSIKKTLLEQFLR